MKTTLKTFLKHCRAVPETYTHKDGCFSLYCKNAPFEFTWADDVPGSGVNHLGWFTEPDGTTYKDGTGKVRALVAELPASPGFPDGRFLAGYWVGGSDHWHVDPYVYSDAASAASEADSEAEEFAEVEREYQEKWQAARALEDKISRLAARVRELWLLRHRQLSYVRDELAETIEQLRSERERLAELEE